MENKQPKLNIFGYTDYRVYLKDYYRLRKEGEKGYSYRQFSKKAGFASPNFLQLIINGSRNLTPKSKEKFVKAIGLEGGQAEYFNHLVDMNQAQKDETKKQHLEAMMRLLPYSKKRLLDPRSTEYLSHWLYPALRELAQTKGFKDDPYWIARRLTSPASVKEIRQAMEFLVKGGYLVREDDGSYTSQDKLIVSGDEVKSLAIRQYHRQMLKQAEETLESLQISEREFGALTLTIPEDRIADLKFKLKEFRRELHLWAVNHDPGDYSDSVVQVNFQMYPLAKGKLNDES